MAGKPDPATEDTLKKILAVLLQILDVEQKILAKLLA